VCILTLPCTVVAVHRSSRFRLPLLCLSRRLLLRLLHVVAAAADVASIAGRPTRAPAVMTTTSTATVPMAVDGKAGGEAWYVFHGSVVGIEEGRGQGGKGGGGGQGSKA